MPELEIVVFGSYFAERVAVVETAVVVETVVVDAVLLLLDCGRSLDSQSRNRLSAGKS